MITPSEDCFVGIDVSQARLDVATMPGEAPWSVANDNLGLKELRRRLQSLSPQLIVLEATGGLEVPAAAELAAAGLAVTVVNPRQACDFALVSPGAINPLGLSWTPTIRR
jgi:transposase